MGGRGSDGRADVRELVSSLEHATCWNIPPICTHCLEHVCECVWMCVRLCGWMGRCVAVTVKRFEYQQVYITTVHLQRNVNGKAFICAETNHQHCHYHPHHLVWNTTNHSSSPNSDVTASLDWGCGLKVGGPSLLRYERVTIVLACSECAFKIRLSGKWMLYIQTLNCTPTTSRERHSWDMYRCHQKHNSTVCPRSIVVDGW